MKERKVMLVMVLVVLLVGVLSYVYLNPANGVEQDTTLQSKQVTLRLGETWNPSTLGGDYRYMYTGMVDGIHGTFGVVSASYDSAVTLYFQINHIIYFNEKPFCVIKLESDKVVLEEVI